MKAVHGTHSLFNLIVLLKVGESLILENTSSFKENIKAARFFHTVVLFNNDFLEVL